MPRAAPVGVLASEEEQPVRVRAKVRADAHATQGSRILRVSRMKGLRVWLRCQESQFPGAQSNRFAEGHRCLARIDRVWGTGARSGRAMLVFHYGAPVDQCSMSVAS